MSLNEAFFVSLCHQVTFRTHALYYKTDCPIKNTVYHLEWARFVITDVHDQRNVIKERRWLAIIPLLLCNFVSWQWLSSFLPHFCVAGRHVLHIPTGNSEAIWLLPSIQSVEPSLHMFGCWFSLKWVQGALPSELILALNSNQPLRIWAFENVRMGKLVHVAAAWAGGFSVP